MPDSHRQMSSIYSNEVMSMHTQMNGVEGDAMVDGAEQFEDSGVAHFVGLHQIDDDDVGDGVLTSPIEAVPSQSVYAHPNGLEFQTASHPNQLTLSFHGEVYVFDDVSAEKVQAVLLLLGGYEVPGGCTGNMGEVPQNHGCVGDVRGRTIQPHRAAALSRFREKKKDRCYEKKIRYSVRKEVAHRMKRSKGQFISNKPSSEDMGSASSDGNGSSGAVKDEQETSCKNCGASSKSTPMMRRGPEGPRTLCNACGLKWANKVHLGNTRGQVLGAQDPCAIAPIQLTRGEMNGTVAMPPTISDMACFANEQLKHDSGPTVNH